MASKVWIGCIVASSALLGVIAGAGCSSSSSPAAPAADAAVDVVDAQPDTAIDSGHLDAGTDADAAPNPSGLLDPDFNEGGVALAKNTSNPAGGTTDQATSVVLDPQGNIVVAGWTNDAAGTGDESVAVWRFLPTGVPDDSFSADGAWFTSKTAGPSDTLDLGTSLCLDAAGNIVVGGIAHDTTSPIDMALWRVTTNGELDSTFNVGGHVVETDATGASGASWDEAHGVACSSAGIAVAGFTHTEPTPVNGSNMALWHYLDTGALDTTGFDSPKGYVAAVNVTGTETAPGDSANAVVLDSMGRIVVAGAGPDASGNYNAALWRYSAAGAPDTTFNGTGHATFVGAASTTSLTAVAIALDASQNIVFVATGSGGGGGAGVSLVGRVTPAGVADTTFGGTGFVELSPPNTHAFAGTGAVVVASGVAVDSQGRIDVSGAIVVGSVVYAAAWRLLPTGDLDTTFSGGGVFTTTGTAGGSVDGASGIAVDRMDRPVLVGSSAYATGGDTTAMAIWRLTP
jgi:uncharacterized delta-60 repeat protein